MRPTPTYRRDYRHLYRKGEMVSSDILIISTIKVMLQYSLFTVHYQMFRVNLSVLGAECSITPSTASTVISTQPGKQKMTMTTTIIFSVKGNFNNIKYPKRILISRFFTK